MLEMLKQIDLDHYVVFFVLQLVNVIFSTVKSMILINGKAKTAAIVNAFYYALYNCLLILITKENLLVVIIVSFITNLIGVYTGKKINSKLEGDKLYIYNGFVYGTEEYIKKMRHDFEDKGLGIIYNEIKKDEFFEIKIYSRTKDESRFIEDYLKEKHLRYYIVEAV